MKHYPWQQRRFAVASLLLCVVLLLQSGPSGALSQHKDPPWRDLEAALLQLADAETNLALTEIEIDAWESELAGHLLLEGRERALEVSYLIEMLEAEDLARVLAIEAYMGGDPLTNAAYLLSSESVGDLTFRRAILIETTNAIEKHSRIYAEMRSGASIASLELAEKIDEVLVSILRGKANRSKIEEKIREALYVVQIAQIHKSADLLKARNKYREPSEEQWKNLRFCESTETYNISIGNGYYGAYQFNLITWVGVGGEGSPSDAPPEEQDARARYLYHLNGWIPWPECGRFLPQ
ncbi:MAG: transglycosylase family protein [Acidimicrobiales bacterium]|nr:transglycosylase family protein [Acidimicrobiales bacterium]